MSAETASSYIASLVARSRRALRAFASFDQTRVDDVVTAAAWAVCNPENAARLARAEVDESGMGNVADKTYKNIHRVFGTLAQLKGVKSVGVIEMDADRGITKIAKPKGVFAALTPSTNMATGTTQNAMAVLKGRNSVIFSPQPRTRATAALTCSLMAAELEKVGAPEDLVLVLPRPTRALRDELMRQADVILATGGVSLVRTAYASGKPAIGVGPGNSVTVIDGTTDLREAAEKVVRGKTFDFGTSCSTENAAVVEASSYDAVLSHFRDLGGYVLDADEREKLAAILWGDGKLNGEVIARSPAALAKCAGLSKAAERASFFLVEESGVGRDHPFSGEKLCVTLAVYRYTTFDHAIEIVRSIIDYQGRGHSCGIHSNDEQHIMALAEAIDVCRVLVNQTQAIGNSGSFTNGLAFTATLGCGSWGGNSIDENVTWEHCVNITRLSRPIPDWRPSEEDVFGDWHRRYGR